MRIHEIAVEAKSSSLNTLYEPKRMAHAISYLTTYYDSEQEARQVLGAYMSVVDNLIAKGGTVYRGIWVERGQQPDLNNPGEHWTLTPKSAEEYLDSNAGLSFSDIDDLSQADGYILSATVGPNNITNKGVNFAEQHEEQEVRIVNPQVAKFKIIKKIDNKFQ